MTKAFDCVEMKREVQARLMAAYEARKSEFSSYAEFVRETAAADPKIRAFREKVAGSHPERTGNAAPRAAGVRR